MKKFVSLFCFSCFIQLAVGQTFTHEFGKYSGEEFQLQQYAKDTTAEAVVLYDIGRSYFIENNNDELDLIFERKMKIKVFSKAGLKWAQIAIPYYEENDKYEEISDLQGNTYNFENNAIRISALNPNTTYTDKINEHWSEKKFAMPDVKEGSVFEISYKIHSPYFFNFRNWEFQQEIPVIYSEYTAQMIPFYEYAYIAQGIKRFDDSKTYEDQKDNRFFGINYHDMIYKFVMKDVPAFKDETFITSKEDYIQKIDFQLSVVHYPQGGTSQIMNTWPKMCTEMLDNDDFGKYMNAAKKKAKEILDPMLIASKPAIEKAKIIDRYMKENFSWNKREDKFATKSVKEFLTAKTGNTAEINLFMAGMLNAAGIEAYPIILSTRDHGKIKLDYPFQHFFNYVIVMAKIDSSIVILDATEPLCTFNTVPERCLNDKGLIIQKNKVEWANIKSALFSKNEHIYTLHPNIEKDSIYEDCKLETTGYEAINYREQFSNSYKKLKKKLLGNNALESDVLTPENLKEPDQPFTISFKKQEALDNAEDKIIIAPFCDSPISRNLLRQATRTYPIDMTYPKTNKFQSTIIIPKGYKLFSKPENMAINTSKIRIIYASELQENGNIKVVGLYDFRKDIYDSADYADLKAYFNMIVNKFNEKVVLVKE